MKAAAGVVRDQKPAQGRERRARQKAATLGQAMGGAAVKEGELTLGREGRARPRAATWEEERACGSGHAWVGRRRSFWLGRRRRGGGAGENSDCHVAFDVDFD
jgi:hypothetical protein